MIPNKRAKDHFNRPSRLSLRVMWIYLRRENHNSTFCWVSQNQKLSLASFSLIFENSSPKGFSWHNMKKSVTWVLKFNSRYLQSTGLKVLLALSLASFISKMTLRFYFFFMVLLHAFLRFHGPLSMIGFYCGHPKISLGHISPLAFYAFRLKIDQERPLLIYVFKIKLFYY